jgi:hypothetical protein
MTGEIVIMLLGAVLVLVGLLGGGFELRELKIPRVGWAARVPALVAGSILLLIGIGLTQKAATGGTDPPPPSQVQVTLFDDLGDGQVSEQVIMQVDGRDMGVLSVNRHYPHGELRLHLPGPGRYSYTAVAKAHFTEAPEEEYSGVGQGMIDIRDGGEFDIEGEISGSTWLITLHERAIAIR